MKNSLEKTRDYVILEDYFRRTFTKDDHFEAYEAVLHATGIDIRGKVSPRGYDVFAKLRDDLRVSQEPLMLEVIRGKGVQRIRIGCGAHAKAEDAITSIRRKSRKMIDLAITGRLHALDDQEVFQNQAMVRIHGTLLSRTSRDAKNEVFSSVSNGYHPPRKFVGLRSILRESKP